MTLQARNIDVTFMLGQGAFGESGADTVKVTGLRCSARFLKTTGNLMNPLELRIWGMPIGLMNKLSIAQIQPDLIRRNTIIVEAGSGGDKPTLVFSGTIIKAYLDGQSPPDVSFMVSAQLGLLEAVKTANPNSFTAPTRVDTILTALAKLINLPFENHGVDTVLPPMYLHGSPRNQILAVIRAAGCDWNNFDNNVLAIWPRGGALNVPPITVSKDTGMIAYPMITANGIAVRSLFNPQVWCGRRIVVESSYNPEILKNQRTWVPYAISYELESELPGGAWFMEMNAAPPGVVGVFS